MEVRKLLNGILLLVLLTVSAVECKKIHKKIPFSQIVQSPHTVFLTRLGISQAGAMITLNFKLINQQASQVNYLHAGIVHAENFYKHKAAPTCEQKEQLYHESYEMKFFDATGGKINIKLGKDKKQHLSFLYIYSCHYIDEMDNNVELSVDVLIANNGSTMEEYGIMLWPYAAMLLGCLVCIAKYWRIVLNELETRKNLASVLLCGGFVLFSIALAFRFFSLVTTMGSGEGVALFDALYVTLKVILEIVVCSILISIAWGWLLNNPEYKIHFASIVVLVTILNILSEILADSNREQLSNEHLYQGGIGKLVLLLRILVSVAFISGCVYVGLKSNPKRQSFIINFAELGSVFLLANIIALIISKLFSHDYRHGEIIPILEDAIELGVCLYLCYLFGYPRENKAEYEEIGLFGFDMEEESMIERDPDESQENREEEDEEKGIMAHRGYEGKSADLI